MKAVLLSSLYLLACGAQAWAQSLSVYSDLAQIDAAGKVTAPETPREILSPALVRNGFNSFQVVVEAPEDAKWWLFVGQNPENSVKVTLYRESGASLTPLDLPYASAGTQVLWMDLWVEANARVQRIKVEPELNINDDWVTYPVEARVMEARIPAAQAPAASMHAYLCGSPIPGPTLDGPALDGPALDGPRLRNSEQDVKLLDAHAAAKEEVKKLLGACDAAPPSNPEWYLGIRDYLFRLR